MFYGLRAIIKRKRRALSASIQKNIHIIVNDILTPHYLWIGKSLGDKTKFGYYQGFAVKLKRQELFLTGIFSVRFLRLGVIKTLRGEKLLSFLETLHTFLNSGILTQNALHMIMLHSTHPNTAYACAQILKDIHRGNTLAKAFRNTGECFPPVLHTIISVCDRTGRVGEGVSHLIEFFKTRDNHQRVIRNTLRYPLLVIAFVVGLYFFVLTFVIPAHRQLYRLSGSELPFETRALLVISDILSGALPLMILIIPVFAGCIAVSPSLRSRLRKWKEKWLALMTQNFANKLLMVSTFKMMTNSGFTADQSLLMMSETFEGQVGKVAKEIRITLHHGETLPAAIEKSGFLGGYAGELLAGTNYTGDVSVALNRIERILFREYNEKMQRIAFWIQPILLLLVSFLTAALLLAVYMPLFNVGFTDRL